MFSHRIASRPMESLRLSTLRPGKKPNRTRLLTKSNRNKKIVMGRLFEELDRYARFGVAKSAIRRWVFLLQGFQGCNDSFSLPTVI